MVSILLSAEMETREVATKARGLSRLNWTGGDMEDCVVVDVDGDRGEQCGSSDRDHLAAALSR